MENTGCFCSVYPKLHYPIKHLPSSSALSQVQTHTRTHAHTQSMHCTLVRWCHEIEKVHCTAHTVWVSKLWSTASLSSHRALTTAQKHKTHVHLPVWLSKPFPHTTNKLAILNSSSCTIRIGFFKRKKGGLVLILTVGADKWLLRREGGWREKHSWSTGGNFAWLSDRRGVCVPMTSC